MELEFNLLGKNIQIVEKDWRTGIRKAPQSTLAALIFDIKFLANQPTAWLYLLYWPKFVIHERRIT
jgi:hypothetical protein